VHNNLACKLHDNNLPFICKHYIFLGLDVRIVMVKKEKLSKHFFERRDFMLLKTLVAAIIGGIIFPFLMKLFTSKKENGKNNNYLLQGLIFAVLFFIILLIIKPYS